MPRCSCTRPLPITYPLLLLVPFWGRFVPGLVSGFKGAFEFIGTCLSSRVHVINVFLAEVVLLQE